MDPKNKTLIPLIIIFFIFGVVVGYVAHKPVTIEKIVTVTVTPVPTPSPTPTPSSTATPTPTPAPIQAISKGNYSILPYYENDPVDKFVPIEVVALHSAAQNVVEVLRDQNVTFGVHPGQKVLFRITEFQPVPNVFRLKSDYSESVINTGGGALIYVQFNDIGTYTFESYIVSPDPSIKPTLYAKGTVNVY